MPLPQRSPTKELEIFCVSASKTQASGQGANNPVADFLLSKPHQSKQENMVAKLPFISVTFAQEMLLEDYGQSYILPHT